MNFSPPRTTGDERLLLAAINRDLVQSLRLRDPDFSTPVPAFNALPERAQLQLCADFMAGLLATECLPGPSSPEALMLLVLADHLPRVVHLELLDENQEDLRDLVIDTRHLLVDAARSLSIDVPRATRSHEPADWMPCLAALTGRWRHASGLPLPGVGTLSGSSRS